MAIRCEAAISELSATEGKVKEVIYAYGVSTRRLAVLPPESCGLPTGDW